MSQSYQARKERSADLGTCIEHGCRRKAMDDSFQCRRCRAAFNASKAESAARERERRRPLRLCVECPKSKIMPATPGSPTCLACRIRRHRIKISDGGVEAAVEVDRSAAIAAATRTHPDGRTRYHGQGKRGQQPRAQLDRQDLAMAEKCLTSGGDGMALLESDEVKALPRIQRSNVKSAALHELDRATRHIDDVLERNGHFGKRHGPRTGEE